MKISRSHAFPLRLLALAALGCCAARPAAAQDEMYTLVGVTFYDGATASGFFVYNPTTDVYGAHDIITTDGTTDGFLGYHYTPADDNPSYSPGGFPPEDFTFSAPGTSSDYHFLLLAVDGEATAPGVYPLIPGYPTSGGFGNSGEDRLADGSVPSRTIQSGSLSVAAVPEASPLALLAVVGVPLGFLALRKRPA